MGKRKAHQVHLEAIWELGMAKALPRQQQERGLKMQEREHFEVEYGVGNVWDTDELTEEFVVICFAAPLVVVQRRSDGVEGTMSFCHRPRYYYNFRPNQ